MEVLGNYVCSIALLHHHFLKVQQAAYLKEAKAILNSETCIILMDFSENYYFLVQDAIPSFFGRISKLHFIPLQCTTMMIRVNLNLTVIVSYQIIYCTIRLQFTVLFY